MSLTITMPGTLPNVTPEMDAPTMPKATMYHGDCLLPRKKVSLSPRPEVRRLTISSTAKYAATVSIMLHAEMSCIGQHLLV